jgi:hypothetical protein
MKFALSIFIILLSIPCFAGKKKSKCLVMTKDNMNKEIQKMLGGVSPKTSEDMIKNFKGSLGTRHDFAGGESKIYLRNDRPGEALKVFDNPSGNIKQSIDDFMVMSDSINNGKLATATKGKLVSPKVLERGVNWIRRQFFKDTIALNDLKSLKKADKKILSRCKKLMSEVINSIRRGANSGKYSSIIMSRINQKSPNIHCDHQKGKIIVIDSLFH